MRSNVAFVLFNLALFTVTVMLSLVMDATVGFDTLSTFKQLASGAGIGFTAFAIANAVVPPIGR